MTSTRAGARRTRRGEIPIEVEALRYKYHGNKGRSCNQFGEARNQEPGTRGAVDFERGECRHAVTVQARDGFGETWASMGQTLMGNSLQSDIRVRVHSNKMDSKSKREN